MSVGAIVNLSRWPPIMSRIISLAFRVPLVTFALTAAVPVRADTPEFPKTLDDSVTVSLFASEPDIVTPIGGAVDGKGRLLVIESQSHFRPKSYVGPATDRIRV